MDDWIVKLEERIGHAVFYGTLHEFVSKESGNQKAFIYSSRSPDWGAVQYSKYMFLNTEDVRI
jgi:hypothetical protein